MEIETAVAALPSPEQEELFRRLAERLMKRPDTRRRLPLAIPSRKRKSTMRSTPIEALLGVERIVCETKNYSLRG